MKNYFLLIIAIGLIIMGCKSLGFKSKQQSKININYRTIDTIWICNDKGYEMIIIDNGFYDYLTTVAKPRYVYREDYLEQGNRIYTLEWNHRVDQPEIYDTNLYKMKIDYKKKGNYGYEVNYFLYNYFIYFQNKYSQTLGGFVPRN